MPRGPSFDERIMDLGAFVAPPGREPWARAMRAEFEAIGGPRTGWALGCLGAAAGWRLRVDGVYLLMFALTAGFAWRVLFLPFFWAVHLNLVPKDLQGPAFQYGRFVVPAVVCLAFAAVHPRYWTLVGLGFPVAFVGLGVIATAHEFHSSIWDVHPFNATLEVGTGAQMGYCLLGALIGRTLGSARAARSA